MRVNEFLCNKRLQRKLPDPFPLLRNGVWPRETRFSTADLDFENFGASHGFVGIFYSSRLILLYSNHLEGRQTVENHLVHIGTNLYRRTHVMTSSTSILVHFLRFLFLWKQVSPRRSRKFAPSENFPLYGTP